MKKVLSIVGAFALITSVASPALALSVNGSGSSSAIVQIGTQLYNNLAHASSGASGAADANVSASGNGSADAGVSATVQANTSVSANTSQIVVTRADVDAGTVGGNATTPADVHAEGDLYGFIASSMHADSNLSAASASSHAISVTYKEPARLFAVIPMTLEVTATVNADGSATVSYPWYGFLFAKDSASLTSDVQTAVAADVGLNPSPAVAANGTFAADMQARLITDVQAAMMLAASGSASAHASASTQ